MHDISVASIPTPLPAAPRASRQGPPSGSFQDLLEAVVAGAPAAGALAAGDPVAPRPAPGAADPVVVFQGDCLSRICAERLKEQGRPVSQRAIHAAVQAVAKANHLADPDRVYPGQRLDVSLLSRYATRQERPCAPAGNAQAWQSLVEGAVAVSSEFGLRKDPFTGRLARHSGIDVAAAAGAPIAAFEAGSVVFSGWKPGYGNTVILRHENGLETLYGHIAKALVEVGQQVAARAPIARVGSNGRSTGPHLHFEVRRHGLAIDPMIELGAPQPLLRTSA